MPSWASPGRCLGARSLLSRPSYPSSVPFSIWGPIALYLLLTATWVKAAILIGWGVLAIGMIDNVLYPFLVGGTLRIHTVPTFFSILGGITAFGPAGLILGPLILSISIALLDVWWQRTGEGHSAEEEVADVPQPLHLLRRP